MQVIAPAGSGKTTALIERVARVAPAGRGRAADPRHDLQPRRADRAGGTARGRGRALASRRGRSTASGCGCCVREGMTRPGGVRQLSLNQWKRLCALASRESGTWVEAADARAAISEIKLGRLATAREFRPQASEMADGETIARIYALYEAQQSEQGVNDFDDMVMLAVRALRADPALRARWQGRFSHVLVDEYQDIEPAQELLVRILAAPEDALFCVGDEDQTLYGWRRASVRRMIELDLAYPGLRRVSLVHNYRCPPEIVAASAQLVGHNAIRFPKRIEPAPGRAGAPGAIELHQPATQAAGAARVATALRASARGQIVVLARTTNLLRTVALACADRGVRISARRGRVRAARRAAGAGGLPAAVRLARARRGPRTSRTVCRAPNRGLPYQAEEEVAALLRDRFSFTRDVRGARGRAPSAAPAGERGRRPRRARDDHRRAPVHRVSARRRRPRRVLRRARGGVRRDRADRARGARAGAGGGRGQDRRRPTARSSKRGPTRCARSATTSTGSS